MKARIKPPSKPKEGFVDSTDYIKEIYMIQYEAGCPYIEEHMEVYAQKYNEVVDKFNFGIDEKMPVRGVFTLREEVLPHISGTPSDMTIRLQKWESVVLQRDENKRYMNKNNPEVIKQLISQGVVFFDKRGRDITEKLKGLFVDESN